ncbi:MAG: response regulator [Gammaproteobacteria bacterium]|nr:response regulator [Gammaproteobacteria bacterium]
MKEIQILVVDDDPSARDLLASTLRTIGYSAIQTAADEPSAEHALKRRLARVVFLDIELSGASGFDVLRKLKIQAPDIDIIMVSAHSTADNVKQAVRLGAKGFVVKPYTIGKLKDVMAQFDE